MTHLGQIPANGGWAGLNRGGPGAGGGGGGPVQGRHWRARGRVMEVTEVTGPARGTSPSPGTATVRAGVSSEQRSPRRGGMRGQRLPRERWLLGLGRGILGAGGSSPWGSATMAGSRAGLLSVWSCAIVAAVEWGGGVRRDAGTSPHAAAVPGPRSCLFRFGILSNRTPKGRTGPGGWGDAGASGLLGSATRQPWHPRAPPLGLCRCLLRGGCSWGEPGTSCSADLAKTPALPRITANCCVTPGR